MTYTKQITFKGVDLDLTIDYLAPEPETGFSGEESIAQIFICGMDAYELLEDQKDEILKQALNS